MLNLPDDLLVLFQTGLVHKAIPKPEHWAYPKWLGYYLEFCHKLHRLLFDLTLEPKWPEHRFRIIGSDSTKRLQLRDHQQDCATSRRPLSST